MVDLWREWRQAGALSMPFGLSPITIMAPGRFRLSDDCRQPLHMILPDDADWPVDLVAFHRARPDRWWVRTGAAAILGEGDIEVAAPTSAPLLVAATPLSWLRCRRAAICILDWSTFNPRRHLDDIGVPVRCETQAVEIRLRDQMNAFAGARFEVLPCEGLRDAA